MQKKAKGLVKLVLIITMLSYTVITFGFSLEPTNLSIPEQVKQSNGYYIEIPVYYNKAIVSEITTHLNKTYVNGGKTYTLDGDVSFKVKGYAYKSGNDVKIGLAYGYYGYKNHPGDPENSDELNPVWIEGFYDRVGQDSQPITVEQNQVWNNDPNSDSKLIECKQIMNANNYTINFNEVKFKDFKEDTKNQTRELFWFATAQKNNQSSGNNFYGDGSQDHGSSSVAFVTFKDPKPIKINRTAIPVSGKKNVWEVTVTIDNTEFAKQNKHIKDMTFTDKVSSHFKILEVTSKESNSDKVTKEDKQLTYHMNNITNGDGNIGIFKYTIEMIDGNIGEEYPISEEATAVYTFPSEKEHYIKSILNGQISNPSVKASWAKLTVEHKDERDVVLTKNGNGPYTFNVWVNVENKSNVQVNPSSLIAPSTMELKEEGTVTIANYVTIPNYQCLGRRIATGEYSLTQAITLTKINNHMALFYRKSINTLTVGLKVISGTKTKDTYKGNFLNSNKMDTIERILKGSELIVEKNAYIQVEIEGFDLKEQGYKIIKDTNKPTLPLSEGNWVNLGVLNDSEKNRQENYPDMILDQSGYISTRHYDYSKTNATREATFGSPIGENLVIQKATGTGNKIYSAVSGANAFFENSNITSEGGANKAVKFWGYLKPTGIEAGEFNLGSNSDDGAYGYIMLGDERKVFVEDWKIEAAHIRSNGANIRLEPGKVYPIYMEWYEGQPVCKSFLPSYKEVGGEWKTIPQEWFYPSSNTEPGDVNTAYFVPKTTSSIPLGETPGTYYVVVDVKDKAGNERQLSYGPIKIEDNVIANMGSDDKNNKNVIIPTSISNIYWETTLPDEYKDVSYTIDLSALVNEKINDTDKLIDLNLNQSEIKRYLGITINPKPLDYELSVEGSYINIKMNKSHSNTLISGKQTIAVYIRTDMGNKTNYTNYKNNYLGKTREIEVKTYGKKKYYEQEVQEDGTITQRECYIENSDGSAPEISSIKFDMKFKEIPIIN